MQEKRAFHFFCIDNGYKWSLVSEMWWNHFIMDWLCWYAKRTFLVWIFSICMNDSSSYAYPIPAIYDKVYDGASDWNWATSASWVDESWSLSFWSKFKHFKTMVFAQFDQKLCTCKHDLAVILRTFQSVGYFSSAGTMPHEQDSLCHWDRCLLRQS